MSAGRREHRYGPVVRWAWLALMGLVVSGCNAAQVLVASPGDYASYRRIRLATNLDDKLSAAAAYLQRHPEGRYARRIRRYVAYAEPIYFRVRRRSPKGLQAYLAALPDGPNRQQALGELTKMRRQRGESSAERLARRSTIRLKFESEDRARAAATVGFWVSQLMAPRQSFRPGLAS